jgi:hypothetical protein
MLQRSTEMRLRYLDGVQHDGRVSGCTAVTVIQVAVVQRVL